MSVHTCPNCQHVFDTNEPTHVTIVKLDPDGLGPHKPITYKLGKQLLESHHGHERECLDSDGYVIRHVTFEVGRTITHTALVGRGERVVYHKGDLGPTVGPHTLKGILEAKAKLEAEIGNLEG